MALTIGQVASAADVNIQTIRGFAQHFEEPLAREPALFTERDGFGQCLDPQRALSTPRRLSRRAAPTDASLPGAGRTQPRRAAPRVIGPPCGCPLLRVQ